MTRPVDDLSPEDDWVAERLAEYDAALADGRSPPPREDLDSATCTRLDLARSIVDRLEELWPRSMPSLPLDPPELGRGIPFVFGRFQVRSELGAGGCGVVFLADDPILGRPVALKVPRPAALADAGLRRRFLREAQAAAILSHPHIIPVYEASTVGGVCYIAAEYCPGPTLAQWLLRAGGPVPPRDAAGLVAALATAVGFAHSRGVVHRDLKPSNVLLDGPTRAALPDVIPKVTDFGFAKLLEQDDNTTRSGAVIGTPQYMAPEQADGRSSDAGPAADVYALGVILYETLTGRPPHVGTTPADTLRRVVAEMPRRPRSLHPSVPRDLEAVCLKCLEKQTDRRYPDGDALAADLARFLAGRPTQARPVRWPEAAGRWCRRNPVVSALTVGLAAAVVSAGYLAVHEYTTTKTLNSDLAASLHREREQAKALRDTHYVTRLRHADRLGREGRHELLLETLSGLVPEPGTTDLREFAWHYLWRQARPQVAVSGHESPVVGVAVSPDRKYTASAAGEPSVSVWSAATGQRVATLDCTPVRVSRIAWVRDWLVAVEGERADGVRAVVWDTTAWRRATELTTPLRIVSDAAPWVDGRVVLAGGDRDGGAMLVGCDPVAGVARVLRREAGRYLTVRTSPNGAKLALTHVLRPPAPDCELLVGPADRPEAATRLDQGSIEFASVDFAPDGRLAVQANDTTVSVWNLDPPRLVWRKQTAIEPAHALVGWANGGRDVVTYRHSLSTPSQWTRFAADDGRILHELSDLPTPQAMASSHGAGPLYAGVQGGAVRVWMPPATERLAGHPAEAWAVTFAPNGRLLATASDDATIKLWDIPHGREIASLRGHDGLVMAVAFSSDGGTLYSAGWDGTVRVWDVEGQQAIATWSAHAAQVGGLAVSPDGRLLATKGRDGTVKIWQTATRELLHHLPGPPSRACHVTFVAGGSVLAAVTATEVVLWDPSTGRLRGRLAHTSGVWGLAGSPDGRTLAVGDNSGTVSLWDVTTRRLVRSWWAHNGDVRTIAFDPSGWSVVTGGFDDAVRLWHTATGQPLITLDGHRDDVYGVAFSPFGDVVASCSHDGEVRIWRGRE